MVDLTPGDISCPLTCRRCLRTKHFRLRALPKARKVYFYSCQTCVPPEEEPSWEELLIGELGQTASEEDYIERHKLLDELSAAFEEVEGEEEP